MMPERRQSILNLSLPNLTKWLERKGHPSYRAGQIFQWLYQRGAVSYDAMLNVPKAIRQELADTFDFQPLPLLARSGDPGDGTLKLLLGLPDGDGIETALMPRYNDKIKTDPKTGHVSKRDQQTVKGYTACLTTQVGCMFACRFCASGQRGLKRNLTTGEIIAQVLALQREGKEVSRIVFMGTGEPLQNWDAVRDAISILNAEEGFGLSSRRMTLSTVGLVPEIYRLAKEDWKVKLAVSLHATTDAKRAELIPMSNAYQLDQVMDALRFFQRGGGRRISLEYLMIDGFNDSPKDADRLKKLCQDTTCHINLIPFNPVPKTPFRASTPAKIQSFRTALRQHGLDATVRYSRGRSIDAACGQLRLRHIDGEQ